MKVSIIIPVYKAEKYLPTCVDSVLSQTYKDLEVILIDDASPDKCGEICEEYAKKDERVKVIHKENEGVSKARNAGLEIATGDYVQFVDSDDYLEPNMTEKLVNAMEINQADMVLCGFYEKNLNFQRASKADEEPGVYSKEVFLKNIMNNPYSFHYGVLWNKMFKGEALRELRFSSDMDFGEDFVFNLHYLRYVEKIAVIDDPLYYYIRFNTDSLMYVQTIGKKETAKYLRYLEKRLLIFHKYRDFYVEQGMYDNNRNKVNEYLLKVYTSEKMEIKRQPLSKEDKKKCLALLESNEDVIKMKQDMDPSYYRKKQFKFKLAKWKVILRDTLVKN
jgi:glycosyltransferase involved in cell wall biosynthesis